MKKGVLLRLMAIMFLQNMIVPTWFNTVAPYVRTLPGGEDWIPLFGMLMGIGVFASPIVCMFADRFWDSGRVLATCDVLAAVLLGAAFFVRSPALLFALAFLAMVTLMPTWSLVAALAMAHVKPASFPYVRVCGSVGWAASAVFSVVAIKAFGCGGFDKSPWIFACAAGVSLLSALVTCVLPPTPPKAKGTPMSVVDALGLRAFTLLRDRSFLVFSAILLTSMVAFQWYFGYNTMYLDEVGFRYLNLVQNAGQVCEIGFMLLIPLLMRRLGLKGTFLVGFAALAFRYGAYLLALRTGAPAFSLAGILVHGLIFGTLLVAAQMHVAESAPPELRNQAQGFVMILTTGIGGFLSIALFEPLLRAHRLANGLHDWTVPFAVACALALLSCILFALFFNPPKARR